MGCLTDESGVEGPVSQFQEAINRDPQLTLGHSKHLGRFPVPERLLIGRIRFPSGQLPWSW